MQPTPGDVHVSVPLTNISVAYVQDQSAFVADRVFPNIPVQKQSDRYWTYDRGYFWRDEMRERAPGTQSAGSGYAVDNTPSYFATTYAYHHDVPDELRANADDPLNPDREASILVTQKAYIKREKTWVGQYFTGTHSSSVWTTTIDGASSAPSAGTSVLQWSDPNSNPISDIRTALTTVLQSTGLLPNVMVMGRAVWDALIDHPDIVDRIKYGQTPNGPAMVSESVLANLFGIPKVLVMTAVENTANEGAANVFSFIGGKHCLIAYAAPSAGIMTPTAGYTFSWTGFLGATAAGYRIKRFRMQEINSDRIEIDMSYTQKLVAADLGYFFDGIVA